MLPFSYDHDAIYLFPVTPNLSFAYWDYSGATWDRLQSLYVENAVLLLKNSDETFRYDISKRVRNYYFPGLKARHTYSLSLAAEIGGRLQVIMESQPATTPADSPSKNRSVRFARFRWDDPLPGMDQPMAGESAEEIYRRTGLITFASRSGFSSGLKWGDEHFFNIPFQTSWEIPAPISSLGLIAELADRKGGKNE